MIRPRPEVAAAPRPVHGGFLGSDEIEAKLDFSHNVNAWGPAASVEAAARAADVASYPDPEALQPRRAVAERWGVTVERVRFAAGAVELIHRVCRTFLRPGDRVLIPGPTFGEYHRAAALAGGSVHRLTGSPPAYRPPWEQLQRTARTDPPRLIFICAPNSPTGQDPERAQLKALLENLGEESLLILDESFRSFSDLTFSGPAFPRDRRVLHIRSLTKDFALAGLRAGLAFGDPRLMAALDAAAIPWSESAPAQAAATEAMSDEAIATVERTLSRLARARSSLAHRLRGAGWEAQPSSTNFLLCRVGDASRVENALLERGIHVRNCTSFGLPEHVRVAVKTPEENGILVQAVEAIQ